MAESLSSRHTAGRDGGSRGSLGLPSTIPCPDPTSMIDQTVALPASLATPPPRPGTTVPTVPCASRYLHLLMWSP